MKDKREIRNIIELFIAWNGETDPIDTANLDSAVDFVADCMQEEPVSEDFKAFEQQYMQDNEGEIVSVYDRHAGLVDGAAWQKQKDFEDMLMSDNRNFIKCYEQGKEDIKQEMMKDTLDCKVQVNGMNERYLLLQNPIINEPTLNEGDKVKLIIIKQN